MIAEIRFRNLLSFRDEAIFSFEADNNKDMESYHVVELTPGIRLLKLAIIYGANASGKRNFIKVCDFIKKFLVRTPTNKGEETGVVPFLMNKNNMAETSDLGFSFYIIKKNSQPVNFVY